MAYEVIGYIGSVLLILSLSPQLIKTYKTKNANDISFRFIAMQIITCLVLLTYTSLNLYIPDTDGKKLDSAYKLAWIRGLKTTYYLRSLGATHVEKSTSDSSGSNLNAVQSSQDDTKQCLIDDPDCEACQ